MSKSLDPDQARHFVGPDLGPKCLPKFSVDNTRRQRLKQEIKKKSLGLYIRFFENMYVFKVK